MKNLIFTIIITLPLTLWGQGWEQTYGGEGINQGNSVQQTQDGGYIITGITNSFGNGDGDVWLIKTDENGIEQWTKTFGGDEYDYGSSVQQTSDGGYIMTGCTYSFGNGDGDVWLIKTDENGIEQWTKTFGGDEYDYGSSVQQTSDGGYIMTGSTRSFGNGNNDVWLIKTDENGIEQWTKTFGGGDGDHGQDIKQTNDGGYIITGVVSSDVYLVKTDNNGDTIWTKTFGGEEHDYGNSVQQTSDGGFIICGKRGSGLSFNSKVYLIKTDVNGVEQWTEIFGGSEGNGGGSSVQQTQDGGYIVCGHIGYYIFGEYYSDVYLVKTDGSGNELWSQTFGEEYHGDMGECVQQTQDGGFIITGNKYMDMGITSDVYLIKTDGNGNISSPTWDCVDGSCINPGTGFGTYTDSLNCIFNCVINSINDINTKTSKIINIIDVFGRTTKDEKRKPLFYIYDDGSVKKKLIIEK